MTLQTVTRGEIVDELELAHEQKKDAEAAYIAALSQIVDIQTLKGGRHGFDFAVEVPAHNLHEITQKIVDIEFKIGDEHGVRFSTYAMPV